MVNDSDIREGVNQILAIARQRAELLENLKTALVRGEDQEIRFYAAKLCGIDYESCRNIKGVNPGTKR